MLFYNNGPDGRYLSNQPGYMAEKLEDWEVVLLVALLSDDAETKRDNARKENS